MNSKQPTAAHNTLADPCKTRPAPPPISAITQPYADLWRVDFVVLGRPIPQPRASHGSHGRKYYPKEITDHRTAILDAFCAASGHSVGDEPYFPSSSSLALMMDCEFVFPLDVKKSWTKDTKEAARRGNLPATNRLLGDWDNLAKMVQDALNGHAFSDDQFVVGTRHTVKRYQRLDDDNDQPRTIVRIEMVNV